MHGDSGRVDIPVAREKKGPTFNLLPGIVYVDSRVGSKELAPIIHKRFACRVSVTKLPAADFAFTCGHEIKNPLCDGDFGCTIGIERKTIGDLVGSLLKNRLGGLQIPDMLTLYDYIWILIEGKWRPADDDAIEQVVWSKVGDKNPEIEIARWRGSKYALTYTALLSWLARYEVLGRGRIMLWRTSTIEESASFIASRFRWWKKEWKKHQINAVDKMPPPTKALLWKANDFERVVASHRHLGYVHMRKVTNYFKSEIEFVNASMKELRAAGLGKADAVKVYAAIRREYR